MNFDLRERTILLTVGGSRAYGIHTPASDVDVKGVAVPTKPYFLGFDQNFAQADQPSHLTPFLADMNDEEQKVAADTKIEGSIYEIRKFLKLASDANPNILDVLFCRDEEVRVLSPQGMILRDNRALFVSAKCKHTFSGYAASQLKRIRGHRSWLLNPPKKKPTRADFGLPEKTLIPKDEIAAAEAAVRKQLDSWNIDFGSMSDAEQIHLKSQIHSYLSSMLSSMGKSDHDAVEEAKWLAAAETAGLSEKLIYVMQKEREYKSAFTHFKQYEEWKENRNEARASLEAKYGYDTKHGAHLVRLLKMGREILETGEVHVWRGGPDGPNDREELLSIRNGAWDYDRLDEWADREDKAMETMYQNRQYVVPKSPDRKAIDGLCVQIVESML